MDFRDFFKVQSIKSVIVRELFMMLECMSLLFSYSKSYSQLIQIIDRFCYFYPMSKTNKYWERINNKRVKNFFFSKNIHCYYNCHLFVSFSVRFFLHIPMYNPIFKSHHCCSVAILSSVYIYLTRLLSFFIFIKRKNKYT